MSLASAMTAGAGLPTFYGGYSAARQRNEESDLRGVQQAAAQQGLLAKLQEAQKQKSYEEAIASIGPNPTQEQLAQVASKFAGPEATMRAHQSSLDRQATTAAQSEAAAARVAQQREAAAARAEASGRHESMLHEFRMSRLTNDAARNAELKRHNEAQEAINRQLAELRGQAAASRPMTATEIVDPANPARMLKIDARTYKGGTLGAPGVIGIAGKEPSAAKREEKEGQGKELLKSELDNLREHYRVLNEARAIPSSDRGAMSNAAAWVQGSTVGQVAGRIVGTKEQDARNQIQSARLRILNAIKNATGMSAHQLNSNIELKTWLDSLTSLTGSYESNVGIIDSIEQAFLKAKGGPGGAGEPPAGVDKAVWEAMTPEERALWQN